MNFDQLSVVWKKPETSLMWCLIRLYFTKPLNVVLLEWQCVITALFCAATDHYLVIQFCFKIFHDLLSNITIEIKAIYSARLCAWAISTFMLDLRVWRASMTFLSFQLEDTTIWLFSFQYRSSIARACLSFFKQIRIY